MSLDLFGADYVVYTSYAIGALSGFSLTQTIKRDRLNRADVRSLSRFEIRAMAGGFALVMTLIPLMAFSDLPLQKIAAHSAINGVLFPMVTGIVMTLAEKRSPGAAKMIERAAAGQSMTDDTTMTKEGDK